MPHSSTFRSAEIIPFPVRFRAPAAAFDAAKTAEIAKGTGFYDVSFSSSWYHEAAIEDALKGPKS